MPSRLSTSLPVTPRTSNSPLAMSLTTTSRPFIKPHLLHSSESYMSGAGRQSGLRQGNFNISDLILPPLQAREPLDQIHNSYHQESNPRPYNYAQDQHWPKTSISRQANQSYQSSTFSPINSAAGESNDTSVRRRQSRDSSPPRQSVESGGEEWQPDILKAPFPVNIPLRPYGEDVPRSAFEQHREVKEQESRSDLILGLATSSSPKNRKFRFVPRLLNPAVAKAYFQPDFSI